MNMKLFILINNLANKNIAFDKIMIFFSKYVPYIFMAALVVVFVLGIIKKNSDYRKVAVNTLVITVINLLLNFTVGSVYYENKPFIHNKVNLLFPHVKGVAFPSNHATGTMSIALGLEKYNKMLSILLTKLSIIVGFSRIYVGHYYPMDIIGAYITVFIINYIYDYKLKSKVEGLYEIIEKKLVIKSGFKALYRVQKP